MIILQSAILLISNKMKLQISNKEEDIKRALCKEQKVSDVLTFTVRGASHFHCTEGG